MSGDGVKLHSANFDRVSIIIFEPCSMNRTARYTVIFCTAIWTGSHGELKGGV